MALASAAAVPFGIVCSPAWAQQLSRSHNVVPIAQSTSEVCWAAAAAMLLSWKRGFAVSELTVAKEAGGSFLTAYNANNGLPGTEIANLAAALNLVTEPPQNYTPQGYYDLLQHGPLWVGTAIFTIKGAYGHIRIVTGIEGDGSFNGTKLSIIDPDGGQVYNKSVTNFAEELEEVAKKNGSSDLFPQVIRLP